jgi:hypothetical protein
VIKVGQLPGATLIQFLWYVHRRKFVVACVMPSALLAVLGLATVAVRMSSANVGGADLSPDPSRSASGSPTIVSSGAATGIVADPSDVASWDAIPPVVGSPSPEYPAIAGSDAADATAYAGAFAAELFTRDYSHSPRDQLLAWAQNEDSPLRAVGYPKADWTKMMLDSLTDITWEDAADTPIPSPGAWLAFQAQQVRQVASAITVTSDPTWEQLIAGGYVPPDPMAVERDVSLVLTVHRTVAGLSSTSHLSVSLKLQLGSSPRRPGYALAASNGYLVTAEP